MPNRRRRQSTDNDVVETHQQQRRAEPTAAIPKLDCELFNPETCDYQVWNVKFQNSIKLAGIEDGETRKMLFINALNTPTLATLINLCKPSTLEELSYDELHNILRDNYKVKKIAIAERVKFFSRRQGSESLADFAASLRRVVDDCQFPRQFYQQALITAFVMGTNNTSIKTELLKRDYVTFTEVVDLASTLDSISVASCLGSGPVSTHEECHLLKAGPCFVCGGNHWKKDCRIQNPFCKTCGRRGHLAKVCK